MVAGSGRYRLRLAILSALISGCGPSPAEPRTGESTTDASTTDASTTDASTTTAAPTSSGTDDTTSTAPPPDLPTLDPDASCLAYCMQDAACRGGSLYPSCMTACHDRLDSVVSDRECFVADIAYTECLAALPCEDLFADQAGCDDALWAWAAACRLCWGESGPTGPDSCFWAEVCPGRSTERIECDATVCTCTIDGVPASGCPSLGCDQFGIPDSGPGCCQ